MVLIPKNLEFSNLDPITTVVKLYYKLLYPRLGESQLWVANLGLILFLLNKPQAHFFDI